ncbi:MAG: Cache 3/Cache 2 fusion domain-containing protein [Desulfobacter sp.]|nr:MAG: Cache 3/Cache 2 fusion domain-containing protein [Desulfobacter sp.]
MKLSLKKKFLIPTISAAVTCLAVISVVSYSKSSAALEHMTGEQVKYVSSSVSKHVSSWIDERKNDIRNFAQEEIFKTAFLSPEGSAAVNVANLRLANITGASGLFESIALAGTDGNIIASSAKNDIGKMNVSNRGYFQAAMAGNIAISDVIKSKSSGNPVFVIASPVNQNNRIKGILLSVIEMNAFAREFIDTEKVGETGYVYVMNKDGKVIAYPDKSKILNLDLSRYEFGRKMLGMGTGLIKYTFQDVDKVVAFAQERKTGWIIASTANNEELFKPIYQIRNISAVISFTGIALISVLLFLITRSIVNPINRIISGLEDGACQVASAAGQISSSSQALAEGASQQAAAIEETSSSIDEMAAMTNRNADNSQHADTLMKTANQVVAEANTSMTRLSSSMADISKASEETSKIIKTIDEIAFQTNLLALNAAVEAARAGDAGAGFAVVADEVRSLALRAADAAKDTEILIEGVVKKVGQGSELVATTNAAFEKVAENSDKVGELLGEISEASKEQAEGIGQVNISISEMDKVVQHNAANAEESASASEEMNAQAEQLRGFVGDLVALVSGKEVDSAPLSLSQQKRPAIPYQAQDGSRSAGSRKRLALTKNEVRPEQVIPLDGEDGFRDF